MSNSKTVNVYDGPQTRQRRFRPGRPRLQATSDQTMTEPGSGTAVTSSALATLALGVPSPKARVVVPVIEYGLPTVPAIGVVTTPFVVCTGVDVPAAELW